jgi:F420H(2)-dependent quinone reductase
MDADRIATRLNPLVAWILRSPVHGLLSGGLLLLSFTGRRSGRRVTLPVGYRREGEAITVLASRARRKQWWRNFAEPRPVDLILRGRERTGEARLVRGESEEFRAAVEATFQRLPRLGGQFGIAYDRSRGLTPEQWRTVAAEGVLVRIALHPR